MAEAAYILCFLTSLVVVVLLLRGYARTRARMLLWIGLGFTGFCVNNAITILDLMVFPNVDFSVFRNLPTSVGLVIMIAGLIFDAD